jgi:hypothetical protein
MVVIPHSLGDNEETILDILSPNVFFFLNTFSLQLDESVDAEPTDTES